MRVCVPIVALTAIFAGCRANPGFLLRGERGDDSTGDAASSTGEPGDSTGPELCEPVDDQAYDTCKPNFPLLPLSDFNVAQSEIFPDKDTCGVFTSMLVRRVGDDLQRCDTRCDDTCSATVTMDISFAAKIDLLAPLLPDEGTCATMWHTSRANPDPEGDVACTTTGFLLMDEAPPQRLRVYVTFDSETPDPFADRQGAPLSLTALGDNAACDLGDENTCTTDFFTDKLHLSFGACEVDTHQSIITTNLRVDRADYTLEMHNAYRCLDNKTRNYRWWLRREF